jgi:hypothetical protein
MTATMYYKMDLGTSPLEIGKTYELPEEHGARKALWAVKNIEDCFHHVPYCTAGEDFGRCPQIRLLEVELQGDILEERPDHAWEPTFYGNRLTVVRAVDMRLRDLTFVSGLPTGHIDFLSIGWKISLWYKDGKLHREDGEAFSATGKRGRGRVIWREWWRDGVCHRDGDDPARISGDEDAMSWFKDGVLHRDQGPAVLSPGYEAYWQHGVRQSQRFKPVDLGPAGLC